MIVDINNVPGLDYHHVDDEGNLHIGALCRHVDLEESTTLADTHPTLAAAAELVSDPIVRTRGTFVGSVCHADPQGDWQATMLAQDGYVVAQGPNGRRRIEMRDSSSGHSLPLSRTTKLRWKRSSLAPMARHAAAT